MEFLENTRVGRIPGLAIFGAVEEESDLEEIGLWADYEVELEENEEGGPGPP